ncbi:hypothetical protein OROHE_016361 [Orobanche hederae]
MDLQVEVIHLGRKKTNPHVKLKLALRSEHSNRNKRMKKEEIESKEEIQSKEETESSKEIDWTRGISDFGDKPCDDPYWLKEYLYLDFDRLTPEEKARHAVREKYHGREPRLAPQAIKALIALVRLSPLTMMVIWDKPGVLLGGLLCVFARGFELWHGGWKFVDELAEDSVLVEKTRKILRALREDDGLKPENVHDAFFQIWKDSFFIDKVKNRYSKDRELTDLIVSYAMEGGVYPSREKPRMERLALVKEDGILKYVLGDDRLPPTLLMRGFLCISIVYWMDDVFKDVGLSDVVVKEPENLDFSYKTKYRNDVEDLEIQFKNACDMMKDCVDERVARTALEKIKSEQYVLEGGNPYKNVRADWVVSYDIEDEFVSFFGRKNIEYF